MSRLTRLSRLKKLMKPRLAQQAAGRMENQKRKQEADIDEVRLFRGKGGLHEMHQNDHYSLSSKRSSLYISLPQINK